MTQSKDACAARTAGHSAVPLSVTPTIRVRAVMASRAVVKYR